MIGAGEGLVCPQGEDLGGLMGPGGGREGVVCVGVGG